MMQIEILNALARLFKLLDGTQHSIQPVLSSPMEQVALSSPSQITLTQIPILNGKLLIPSPEKLKNAQILLDQGFIDINDVDLFLAGDYN